jgi:hypothetical protein
MIGREEEDSSIRIEPDHHSIRDWKIGPGQPNGVGEIGAIDIFEHDSLPRDEWNSGPVEWE